MDTQVSYVQEPDWWI